MQVLKTGSTSQKIDQWWVGRTIACENCKASLKIEAGDKVTAYSRKGAYATDSKFEQRASVDCPECRHSINFKE